MPTEGLRTSVKQIVSIDEDGLPEQTGRHQVARIVEPGLNRMAERTQIHCAQQREREGGAHQLAAHLLHFPRDTPFLGGIEERAKAQALFRKFEVRERIDTGQNGTSSPRKDGIRGTGIVR
jgi:hypothetical protein